MTDTSTQSGKQASASPVLRPAQCRTFMRKQLAAAFPKIMAGFVRQAAKGSCTHLKLAYELLGDKQGATKKQKKGSAQKLLEELGKLPKR